MSIFNSLPSYEGSKYILNQLKFPLLDTLIFNYFDQPLLKISYIPFRSLGSQGRVFCLLQALDSYGVYKHSLWSRVACNALFILGNISKGFDFLFSGWEKIKDQRDDVNRCALVTCGIFECVLGGFLLFSNYNLASKLIRGISVANTLDSTQLNHVVKENVLHRLDEEKPCKAVILRGPLGFPQEQMEHRFVKDLYRECETRMYRVNTDQELCNALDDSLISMGTPDTLLAFGHGNPSKIALGSSYHFSMNNEKALDCIDNHMPSGSQVFLAGCNTATENERGPSFAKELSKRLIDRKVTGFVGYFKPLWTYLSRIKDKIQLHSYVSSDSEGRHFLLQNGVRTFTLLSQDES